MFSVVVFKAAAPAHLEFHACDTQTPRLNTKDKRNKYEAGSKSEILHQVQSTKEARRCGTIPQEGGQGMNIFVLDRTPWKAAQMMCDKHIPKMIVESAQMMASALIRHGATPDMMPTTKSGTPYKGGYHHHPCTVWAGETRNNFLWLACHAEQLLSEYLYRFNRYKKHACEDAIYHMKYMFEMIPRGRTTPFAQAMPDEFKHENAVTAYRQYYHSKDFAKWEKGVSPPWWWGEPKYACVAEGIELNTLIERMKI